MSLSLFLILILKLIPLTFSDNYLTLSTGLVTFSFDFGCLAGIEVGSEPQKGDIQNSQNVPTDIFIASGGI